MFRQRLHTLTKGSLAMENRGIWCLICSASASASYSDSPFRLPFVSKMKKNFFLLESVKTLMKARCLQHCQSSKSGKDCLNWRDDGSKLFNSREIMWKKSNNFFIYKLSSFTAGPTVLASPKPYLQHILKAVTFKLEFAPWWCFFVSRAISLQRYDM